MQLLIATHNLGKVREYAHLLADLPLTLVSLSEVAVAWDIEETGETFEANAQLKAEGYCQATGLLTLADDSGLEVAALHGAPGVYSARYAGKGASDADRYTLLLSHMADVPDDQRQARFRCVIAIAQPNQATQFIEGTCEGTIAHAPCGVNGFGFDPVFLLPARNQTMAELSHDEKNRLSHRGQAARKAADVLRWMLNTSEQ
jgi:XTP/dITP diphosphohydrolase